jgi:hypothetical protein
MHNIYELNASYNSSIDDSGINNYKKYIISLFRTQKISLFLSYNCVTSSFFVLL